MLPEEILVSDSLLDVVEGEEGGVGAGNGALRELRVTGLPRVAEGLVAATQVSGHQDGGGLKGGAAGADWTGSDAGA